MKAIIFGGTDGHGVIATAISARHLRQKAEVLVVCRFFRPPPDIRGDEPEKIWDLLPRDAGTGSPSLFWGQTFPNWDFSSLKEGDKVIVVDLPLPQEVPAYPRARERGMSKIEALTARGIEVVVIDHHPTDNKIIEDARDRGAQVVLVDKAELVHFGPHDEFAQKWGRIGAICDRDRSVLPITKEEEILSAQVDAAVRTDLPGALQAIENDNEAFFTQFAQEVPAPEKIEVVGYVACVPRLKGQWGFKQLDLAYSQTGLPYAIGLSVQDRGVAVMAATNWKYPVDIPPVSALANVEKYIGHPGAIVVPVTQGKPPTEEEILLGEVKMQEIIANINCCFAPPRKTTD